MPALAPVPYPRGVLPVPTRSEILHFVQNDYGEGMTNGEGMTTERE